MAALVFVLHFKSNFLASHGSNPDDSNALMSSTDTNKNEDDFFSVCFISLSFAHKMLPIHTPELLGS